MVHEVKVKKVPQGFELSVHKPFMFFFTKVSRKRRVKDRAAALRQAEKQADRLISSGIKAIVRDLT